MRNILLMAVLSASSLLAIDDTPKDHSDDLIVYDYSRAWFLINNGKFDEAKEEIKGMPFACEEEVIHQDLMRLYIAIRQKRNRECGRLLKKIYDFSSDAYSTH